MHSIVTVNCACDRIDRYRASNVMLVLELSTFQRLKLLGLEVTPSPTASHGYRIRCGCMCWLASGICGSVNVNSGLCDAIHYRVMTYTNQTKHWDVLVANQLGKFIFKFTAHPIIKDGGLVIWNSLLRCLVEIFDSNPSDVLVKNVIFMDDYWWIPVSCIIVNFLWYCIEWVSTEFR